MAHYIPDLHTKRFVILAPGRVNRPQQHGQQKHETICPFCEGNEEATPPEVFRIGQGNANDRGWLVRVVPNKYPITDIHEVIIHSPDHAKDIEELPIDQVQRIVAVYQSRVGILEKEGNVMIFCNHGKEAGASLPHPHTQVTVIPTQIALDSLSREPVANIVSENEFFISYCPDFSQWPYEVWIVPRMQKRLSELDESQLRVFARDLQDMLIRQKRVWRQLKGDTPFLYNYYIGNRDDWYVRIIPRLVHRAGFELGTGLSVNSVEPSEAAQKLRE